MTILFFIDEPENHLHPEISIKFINDLKSMRPERQLWILTHSINIISEFANDSFFWYMDENEVKYAGRISEKVVSELVGTDDKLARFKEFVTLPERYHAIKFISECLLSPEVVLTDKDDPQIRQIHELINKESDASRPIKLLDFGVGKGRLIANLIDLYEETGESITEKIDYYAYDIDSTHKSQCLDTINTAYNTESKRYYNDLEELVKESNSFDLILLSNVLHEIEPKYWCDLFSDESPLLKLLGESGHLVIVEDQFINTGELAYIEGFLVCDEDEFKILFELENYDVLDARENGRLKAHCIKKK